MPEPITWFIWDENKKRREVNLLQFLAYSLGVSAQRWNKEGPGSIKFPKGKLYLNYGAAQQTVSAEAMYINIKQIKGVPGRLTIEQVEEGINLLKSILGDKAKILKLEKEAYVSMIGGLKRYLGLKQALVMGANPGYAKWKGPLTKRRGGKAKRGKPWWGAPRRMEKGRYSERWSELINEVILRKEPKVTGGAVLSFGIKELMSVEVPSRSPLRSIFMMEEYGTGLYADEDLRRPFAGRATTPSKVSSEMAAAFNYPSAIYLWFPYYATLQKAYLLLLAKKKKGSSIATRWLKEMKDTHRKKMSLANYREFAYKRIEDYKKAPTGIEFNPLVLAYGQLRGVNTKDHPGYPGREARHLFFNRQGLVEQIRKVQEFGYYSLLGLIDKEIHSHKALANFPSIRDMVFPVPFTGF